MTARQDDCQEQIDSATQRLLRRVRGFADADVRQASSLPGWTRGHVLTPYRPQDWPTRFADMELAEPMRTQRDDRAAGRTGR